MKQTTLVTFVEDWNEIIKSRPHPTQTEKLSRSNLEWLEQTMRTTMLGSLGKCYDLTMDDLGYIINSEEELKSLETTITEEL